MAGVVENNSVRIWSPQSGNPATGEKRGREVGQKPQDIGLRALGMSLFKAGGTCAPMIIAHNGMYVSRKDFLYRGTKVSVLSAS